MLGCKGQEIDRPATAADHLRLIYLIGTNQSHLSRGPRILDTLVVIFIRFSFSAEQEFGG